MWTKKPAEIRNEVADWTDVLDGDTITGTPTLALTGSLTCTIDHLSLVDNISTMQITGGLAGESGYIVATINTAGGQVLTPQQALKIVPQSTIVS